MSLNQLNEYLHEYCEDSQFSVHNDHIKIYPGKFKKNVLMEILSEAVYQYGLSLSYDDVVKLVDQVDPASSSREVSNLVRQNDHIIDREEYEDRYVEDERNKTGGDEIYLIVGNQSRSELVRTFIEALRCGLHPVGHDLMDRSNPKTVILGKPAN